MDIGFVHCLFGRVFLGMEFIALHGVPASVDDNDDD